MMLNLSISSSLTPEYYATDRRVRFSILSVLCNQEEFFINDGLLTKNLSFLSLSVAKGLDYYISVCNAIRRCHIPLAIRDNQKLVVETARPPRIHGALRLFNAVVAIFGAEIHYHRLFIDYRLSHLNSHGFFLWVDLIKGSANREFISPVQFSCTVVCSCGSAFTHWAGHAQGKPLI